MKELIDLCPCGSEKEYEHCCKLFHEGAVPENALQLMRSRYSAYVLNISDYIVATTHPASPQYMENKFSWKRSISQFSKNSLFHKLEVHEFKENKVTATVTFTVHLSQNSKDATFTEKSYFEKRNNRWLYRGGQLMESHSPNLITTGQLRLLPLAYYGDPILTKKAEFISKITSDIKKLVEEMVETMDACEGIGLAAPQIHHSIRLFVIRTPIETDQNKLIPGEVEVFINPILSLQSEEMWQAPEGCLSIPIIRSLVNRPKEVTVEYTTLEGKKIKRRVSGWEAKVIMHEYDHLEGILFIDRLDKEEQSKLTPFLQNLKQRIHDNQAF